MARSQIFKALEPALRDKCGTTDSNPGRRRRRRRRRGWSRSDSSHG